MTVPDDPRNRPQRESRGMVEDIEARIRRLEDIAFEGDGLTRAVTRLGVNASALGEALMTVDKNQQRLTKLGQQLEAVERTTVSTEEHNVVTDELRASIVKSATSLSRRLRARAYATCIVVLLMALGAAYYAYWSAATRTLEECTARVNSSKLGLAFYQSELQKDDLTPDVRRILTALEQASQRGAAIDCGEGPFP